METESANNYIKKFPTDFTTKVQVNIPDNNKGILLYSDITTANTAIGNEGLDFTVKEDLNGKSSISIHSEKRNFNIDYIIEALKARFNITIEGKDEFENHLVHSILISIKDWVFLDFADRDFGFIAITDLDVSKFLPFISDVLIGEKNTFNTADFNNIFVMSQECLKHPTTMLENILNNFH